jgi:fluoroquinolone transport system permease protein
MNPLSLFRSAGAVDLRNVLRDDLLAWVAAVPFLMALLYRFGVPPLARLLTRSLGFDLVPYYGLLMSFFVLLAPTMVGMVTGFLLLDERDEGILYALLVTPVSAGSYVGYRIAVPLLLGFAVTVAGYPVAGLAPLPALDLVAVAFVGALTGPVVALFLAAFAENKVAGFALVKVLNTINMLPVFAFFVAAPWQVAAGIVPAYWPMKMTWLAAAGRPYAPYAGAGLTVYALVLFLLLRRFDRRVRA